MKPAQIYHARFLRLSVSKSKGKNLMTLKNLFQGIICENIGHPHDFLHKLSTGTLRPPITLQTTTKLMNFSSSCRNTFQVGCRVFACFVETEHFYMFLSIALSKSSLNDDTEVPDITRLISYNVGPGRNLRIL